jgi:Tat protein secretion system quality control protein TatD with DNase activity
MFSAAELTRIRKDFPRSYFSFGPRFLLSRTPPRAARAAAFHASFPDSLLLETDADKPDQSPEVYLETLDAVYAAAASCLGLSQADMAQLVAANARKLFAAALEFQTT